MKETAGKGIHKEGKWFCSDACLQKYTRAMKEAEKMTGKSCCCH